MERGKSYIAKLVIIAAITGQLLMFSDYVLIYFMELVFQGNPNAFEPLVAGFSVIIVLGIVSPVVMHVSEYLWSKDSHSLIFFGFMITASLVSMVGGLIGYTELPLEVYASFGSIIAVILLISLVIDYYNFRKLRRKQGNPIIIWSGK